MSFGAALARSLSSTEDSPGGELDQELTASTSRSEKCALLPWTGVIWVGKGLCKEMSQSVVDVNDAINDGYAEPIKSNGFVNC